MTTPSTDPETLRARAAEIARGLTEAQRKVLLNNFGPRDRFSTLQALVRRGLVTQRVCFPDGGGFPLTKLGRQVVAHLQGNPHDD